MEIILIGIDDVGEFPYHLRAGEALPVGRVRWRFVAETDDSTEAARSMSLVSQRCREWRREHPMAPMT